MVKNLVERTRARIESRKVEGEQGSLILDILIGMAIFALIAIIAVSAISQYRERAYVQGATSDANAIGLALEAEFTDEFQYPEAVTDITPNVVLTSGNEVNGYEVSEDRESFAVCVEHYTGDAVNAYAIYDSALGGLVESGRGPGEGCPPLGDEGVGDPTNPIDCDAAGGTWVTSEDPAYCMFR